jgi:hypothetical protein
MSMPTPSARRWRGSAADRAAEPWPGGVARRSLPRGGLAGRVRNGRLRAARGDMPRFLLIRGSCHGARSWRDLLPLPKTPPHAAAAIDLPGAMARAGWDREPPLRAEGGGAVFSASAGSRSAVQVPVLRQSLAVGPMAP